MGELRRADEPLLKMTRWAIRLAVKVLAVLMTFVIILGVVDVIWVLYDRLLDTEPYFILEIRDILATFGAFMAVLIAIEIYVNIILYLRDDVIHVKIVLATALMAVARKVIVLDFGVVSELEVLGLALVVVATSIAYWIVHRFAGRPEEIGLTDHPKPKSPESKSPP